MAKIIVQSETTANIKVALKGDQNGEMWRGKCSACGQMFSGAQWDELADSAMMHVDDHA